MFHIRLIFCCFYSRRAVEVVESDERKKTSDPKAETKGECCCDVSFVYCCRHEIIWKSISKIWSEEAATARQFFLLLTGETQTLTQPLLVLGCVQQRGSASLRLHGCCRRFTATEWRHSAATAAALTERVSPCSRSCWSAACCCSYAMGRAKRSSSER